MKWDGTCVWLTGASSGIGAALARELAGRGSRVAISARRVERLEELAAGTDMLVVPCDVTDRAAVTAAEARIRDEFGQIDVAIFNAGTWQQVDVTAFDSDVFRQHIDVNLMGMIHGVESVLPDMLRRRAGRLVGVASVAGYRGFPQSEAYGSTKAAELNLLESLRIDLAAHGITVQTISPGFVKSEATAKNDFTMPFLLEADDAARRMAEGIARNKAEIVFPLPMMLAMKVIRTLPIRPYTDLYARALRRQRR